jgi:site-specific DNA-cytosine methylase
VIVHTNKAGISTPHDEAQALRQGASHNYQVVVAVKGDLFSRHNPQRQCGFDEENMFALRGAVTHGISQANRIRRLTPLECERLQGFPDFFTEWAMIDGKVVKVSDTQRYKCLGNAVTVNVAVNIITQLCQ